MRTSPQEAFSLQRRRHVEVVAAEERGERAAPASQIQDALRVLDSASAGMPPVVRIAETKRVQIGE